MAAAPLIRPYRPEDRAAVALVFFRAVREGAAAFYSEAQRAAWAPRPDPDPARPDKLLNQNCLVAERDGQITGFMSMEADGYLDMAFVLPEVMGDGTAAALYDQLMQDARAKDLTSFTVDAAHQSHRFLSRLGWHVVQREMHEANGQVFERFQMALTLPEG